MKVSIEVEVANPDDDRLGILLRFPFDADVIDALKADIQPARDRGFKPALAGWWVAADHREAAEELMSHWFGSYAVLGEDGGDYVVGSNGQRFGQGGLFDG